MSRISKYERNSSNDIRYRGPLCYQHLNILGWLCISFKVIGVLCAIGIALDPNQPQWMITLGKVSETLGYFALPLFLVANFAIILAKKKTYKQQLIKFGGLSLAVLIVFVLVKEHYLLGLYTAALGNAKEANRLITDALFESAVSGSLIFNLFIDLFLCTLFMFFLEYVPEKHFQGKKLRLFRAMAVLPVLYEVGALVLRVRFVETGQKPPFIVYPLLTTKPFMSFILFILLALRIKFEGVRFTKKGKTEEQFVAYTQTNEHSLRFSIFTSMMIVITGVIDILLYLYSAVVVSYVAAGLDWNVEYTAEVENQLTQALPIADKVVGAWRIGTHWPMMFLIPVILLFSYTRNAKNEKLDKKIPIAGVVLALLVGLEGMHQGIVMNLSILAKKVSEFTSMIIK